MNYYPIILRLPICIYSLFVLCTQPGFAQSSLSFDIPHHITWLSKIDREHSLVGKIWQSASDRFVTISQFQNTIKSRDFVLIGEKHDNPDHHEIEQIIVEYLLNHAQSNVDSNVILEMLDRKQMANVNQQQLKSAKNDTSIKKLLDWQDRSWPWNNYRKIILTILNSNANLIAGNIDKRSLFASTDPKIKLLDLGLREATTTINDMSKAMNAAILDDVFNGHCQLMPKTQMDPMVKMQKMRDAYMAFKLHKSGQGILIAGNGHIRNDYGVGWHLGQRDKNSNKISIALLEVRKEDNEPVKYVKRLNKRTEVYDYIWFTPKFSNEDDCENLKKHLEKKVTIL